eukprot:RCo029724
MSRRSLMSTEQIEHVPLSHPLFLDRPRALYLLRQPRATQPDIAGCNDPGADTEGSSHLTEHGGGELRRRNVPVARKRSPQERSSVLFCLNLSFDIEKLLKAPFDWAQKKENQSLSRCLLIRYSSPSREFWVSAQVLKRQDRKYRPWTKFFIATPHTAAATPTHYSMITPSLEVLKEKVGVM